MILNRMVFNFLLLEKISYFYSKRILNVDTVKQSLKQKINNLLQKRLTSHFPVQGEIKKTTTTDGKL